MSLEPTIFSRSLGKAWTSGSQGRIWLRNRIFHMSSSRTGWDIWWRRTILITLSASKTLVLWDLCYLRFGTPLRSFTHNMWFVVGGMILILAGNYVCPCCSMGTRGVASKRNNSWCSAPMVFLEKVLYKVRTMIVRTQWEHNGWTTRETLFWRISCSVSCQWRCMGNRRVIFITWWT